MDSRSTPPRSSSSFSFACHVVDRLQTFDGGPATGGLGRREWEKGKNGGKEEKRLRNTVLPPFPSVFKKLYFLIYSFLLIISYSPSHSLQIYTDRQKYVSMSFSTYRTLIHVL